MRSRKDLHPYQNRTIEFIKVKRRCGLALFMGAGKTTITLTAISDLSDGLMVNKTLVIAPLRVANTVWKQEAMKWGHLKHLDIVICTGSERQRLDALHRKADIYVINRENVVWLTNVYKKKFPFDCVVLDESHSFKSTDGKRFKALKKVAHQINYITLLSGTPAPNGLLDLWSQQFLIDFGMTLGRTMTAYKQRFFDSDYMGYNYWPKLGAHDDIQRLISPHWLSMMAEDYISLPERIDIVISIPLQPDVFKLYKQFEKNMYAALPDDEEIEALSAATLAGKMLQLANGSVYVDDKKNFSIIHDAKLDALQKIVKDNAGEPILVAYNYKHDLIRLKAKFPQAVVLDTGSATVERWNRGEIHMLLTHPQSASLGLNLAEGGCIAVWFGLTWSLESYLQWNARLHRQGQTRPVRIIHLVAEKTIDERVMSVIQNKDATQNELLEALKKEVDDIKNNS